MGVEGLNQYLLHNVSKESKAIQKVYTNNLKGKKIAVDASIYIYKFFVNNNYSLLNQGINKMLDDFKINKITPIFIFDGKPPKMKDFIINKRNQEKIEAKIMYNTIDDLEIKKKLEKLFIRPNKDTTDYVKNILNERNIKYLNAPNEADPLCAWLVKNENVWACLSDDTDMFIYGCPRVLRSYSIKTKSLMLYDFDKILSELNITFDDFREITTVSNNDYKTETTITIINAFKLFDEFKKTSYKNFITWLLINKHIIENSIYYDILNLMDIKNVQYTIPII